MRYEEFLLKPGLAQLEKRITKVERAIERLPGVSDESLDQLTRWIVNLEERIERLEKGEQEVFAQERSKNLNEAYHMPIPPWVRELRKIKQGEEAFRLERMRKEAADALASAAGWPLKARLNMSSGAEPSCECCK